MINVKSYIFAVAIGSAAFGGAAQAVVLGVPSQALTGGVGFETNGLGTLTFPANSGGFTGGVEFDFNGSGPGGTYTNTNFVNFVDTPGTGVVRTGTGGAAFQANPLSLSVTFDYKASAVTPFGLSTNGTGVTTLLSNLAISALGSNPSTVSFNLNASQLAGLTSGTSFLFDPTAAQTVQISNFRFDVTPVPFEFNPALGVVALAGVAAARKLKKNSKKSA